MHFATFGRDFESFCYSAFTTIQINEKIFNLIEAEKFFSSLNIQPCVFHFSLYVDKLFYCNKILSRSIGL